MKSGLLIVSLLFCALGLPACDKEKDQYSGLSGLVAERNEARRQIRDENAQKKAAGRGQGSMGQTAPLPSRPSKKDETTSAVLYERDIEIVDARSKVSLAKGVAYMNKAGSIVRIKVVRE